MGRRAPLSAYEAAVRKLYQVNMWNPVKLGLENVERLCGLSPRPLSVPIVHIAGTNGKGSVAWKISHGMRAAGYKTGLFVSPHVSSFRERMQVDGQLISESSVETLLPKLFALCEEHGVPATFFELTTVLAFWHFAEQRADVVRAISLLRPAPTSSSRSRPARPLSRPRPDRSSSNAGWEAGWTPRTW